MKPRPEQDEVIRWAIETGNTNRPAAVHIQFPRIPLPTIKSWLKRAQEDGRIPAAPNLVSLPPPAEAAKPEEPAPPEIDLSSLTIRESAHVAIGRRVRRLAAPIDTRSETPTDSARILDTVCKNLPAIEQLEPPKEEAPTSEKGRAILVDSLTKIPLDVLEDAVRKARAS